MLSLQHRITRSLRNHFNVQFQAREGQLIAHVMRNLGLRYYIDIGCFHGGLAREVTSRTEVVSALLVDGVHEHVEEASKQVRPHVTSVIGMTAAVVPSLDCSFVLNHPNDGHPYVHFRIPSRNSLSGAGINAVCRFAGQDVETNAHTIEDVLERSAFPLSESFLKIDAEYLDLSLVESLLTTRTAKGAILPPAFEFEIIETKKWPSIHSVLKKAGYAFPYKLPRGHRYHSVICSSRSSWCVGFEKFAIYQPGELPWSSSH
jgi:hypothetical protein